jgi:RimJ/RimL family protein N-acetyltransferase
MLAVHGHDRTVAEWAQTQFDGLNFSTMHSAFGIMDRAGTLIGAALFSDYYPGGNVELTFVGPRTLNRAIINEIGYHAFVTLGASRVTCKTRKANVDVIRLLKKAGFRWEGNQKKYFGPDDETDTAVLFSFPVENAAKWLRSVN